MAAWAGFGWLGYAIIAGVFIGTVHSFDPCMACAVHTFDAEGKNVAKVKVL